MARRFQAAVSLGEFKAMLADPDRENNVNVLVLIDQDSEPLYDWQAEDDLVSEGPPAIEEPTEEPPMYEMPVGVPDLHVDFFGVGYNDTHEDVLTWQQKMHSRGWTIDQDQLYGPQSEEVCKRFQSDKSLDVDGLVGPETWSATWTTDITESEITAQKESQADEGEHA